MIGGVEEDSGGVRWKDHQPAHKHIKTSSRYGTTATKQTSRQQQKTPGLQGGQAKLLEMR